MRSFFANLQQLTIPAGAGPGDARIVIAGQLPAPLDTYVPNVTFPSATGFAGGLIFYSQGSDSTYAYMAVVEDAPPSDIAGVVIGYVEAGVVKEKGANNPMGLILIDEPGVGVTAQTNADGALTYATDTIALISDTLVRLQATSGDVTLFSALGNINLEPSSGSVNVKAAVAYGTAGSVSKSNGVTTLFTNASTTYTTTGGTVCGTSFVMPPSGKVMIHYMGRMKNSGATASTYITIQVRTGSTVNAGTIVLAADDSQAIDHAGDTSDRNGGSYRFDGTAGSTYNVALLHRVEATTGTYSERQVFVVPVLV
jgi:hypothetical protein